MKRRIFISAAVTATVAAVAGCLGEGPGGGREPTDTPTADPSGTPASEGPRLVDSSFELQDVECGTATSEHTVGVEDGEVTVEGTVDGNDSCHVAELVRGEYVEPEDTLHVEVESVRDEEAGGVCNECIVEIDYVATFTFENGEPGSVRVDQRGSVSGSSSASASTGGNGEATPTPTSGSPDY